MTDAAYPEVYEDENGLIRVRCDAPGERAVSKQVGDGGPEGALEFIRQVADAAGLEVDDTESVDGAGPITIGIPAGA